MTERCTVAVLLDLLEGDREIVDILVEHGVLPAGADSFADEEVEAALVARTLIRELEVNPPGAEIILRLRAELLAMHRQVAELVRLLAEPRGQ